MIKLVHQFETLKDSGSGPALLAAVFFITFLFTLLKEIVTFIEVSSLILVYWFLYANFGG